MIMKGKKKTAKLKTNKNKNYKKMKIIKKWFGNFLKKKLNDILGPILYIHNL